MRDSDYPQFAFEPKQMQYLEVSFPWVPKGKGDFRCDPNASFDAMILKRKSRFIIWVARELP
jgi:hypothetical protein